MMRRAFARLRRAAGPLVLAATLAMSAAAAVAAQQPASPPGGRPAAGQQPQRQDEFVPVDELPPQEQVPAGPLLIAAYAIAWAAILVYVWSLWSRLSRVEKEIAEVSRRVDAQARR
jgi:CcmD family protein